jgi:hypothetical protein
LRHQTSKVGITVIIVIVSGQNKAFNLFLVEDLLVQNGEFSVELTHLNILEHEGRVHDITVWFRDDRNQEVKKNNQNQELISKPNNPDQVDTKFRNPVGLMSNNADMLLITISSYSVFFASEFGRPKAVGWVADVS